jgi:cell division control protein 6
VTIPIVRDPRFFSDSYTPSKLPHREKEVEILYNTLSSGYELNEGLVLLKGEPGIGKTSVAKLSASKLSNLGIGTVHINCRTYRSPSSALQKIIASIIPGVPERGLSYEEMVLMLEKIMSREGKPLLIILDEIEYLREGETLVYTLLRLHEGGATKSPTLVAVARWDPPYTLDDSIKSFMILKLTLEKYNASQLRDILDYRASEALYDGSYDSDVIEKVVELSKHTGNARIALKILFSAARLAEERGMSLITPDLVSEAAARIGVVGITEDSLMPLDTHDKLLLLAAARRLAMTTKGWIKMGDLLEEYKLICEELNVPPYKYTAVWKRVRELRNMGFMEAKRSGEGMKGQSTLISLGSIPAERLAEKLKEILREDLSPLPSSF